MLHNLEENNNLTPLNENTLRQNGPAIHIILDIDDTLANGFHDKDLQELLKHYPYLQNLADENLFINAIVPHLLHPGVIEFIQWIFQMPNVKVSFFSAGHEKRNTIFVHELLHRALGNDFDRIKHTVSIYSRQHLVLSKKEETSNQLKLFKHYYGENKKDLSKILEMSNLDNAILIEDDPSYIASGQERNVLLVPGTDYSNFYFFHQNSREFPNCMGKYILPMNHIFYMAGMLNRILGMKKDCLATSLVSLQYKPDTEGIYERDCSIYDEHQYYLDGLFVLKKLNPRLEFYGGELANEHFQQSSFSNRF